VYNKQRKFYDREYRSDRYSDVKSADHHSFYSTLEAFIDKYQLHNKQCLEIGCGRGAFQDMVSDYTGVDISKSVRYYLHKPFCTASVTELPFKDNSFDAIWSYAVLEHVPNPENALTEIRRVLRNNGLLLLAPAWQCRSWAAEGYPVRPYGDFDLRGKLIKASIPIRDSVLFRSTYIFPMRIVRSIKCYLYKKPLQFRYRNLKPNYDKFWMSDSDAVNSIDPYEAILWFVSRGDECLMYTNWLSKFLVRTGPLEFRISKT